MSPRRLVIVGAGGFARETVEIARRIEPDTLVAFVDDAPSDDARRLMAGHGAIHLGAARTWQPGPGDSCVIAIGDPTARASLAALLDQQGTPFGILVHPDATVATSAVLRPGVIVAAGARVSVDVELGHHVHLDQNVTVGHDTTVGAFARLNPQACVSGSVTIGEQVLVGASATILQGLSVGAGSTVGAGAVVVRDVPQAVVVKGVPAR